MPDEKPADDPNADKKDDPLTKPIIQIPAQQNVISQPASGTSNGNQGDIEKLEKDIWKGEKWLVAASILGVFVNILIACIYYGQLGQMRAATEASTKAVQLAQDSFELGDGDFQRTMRQTIYQTKAQIDAANASTESNRINRESLESVQRAFIA